MIKAEIFGTMSISDHITIGATQVDAKGEHHELVVELGSIIKTFYEEPEYQEDVLKIFEYLIKKDLDEKTKEGKT